MNKTDDLLTDEYDTRRLLARLLYLLTKQPKRRKLPIALEPHAKKFVSGELNAKIGDVEYTYEELLEISLDENE